MAYGLQSARALGQLQYSRRAEAEADAEGMKMLLAARIDPAGMFRFLDALMKGDKQPRTTLRYFSTHPGTGDRVARLWALAAQASGAPVKLLPEYDWGRRQAMVPGCGLARARPAVPGAVMAQTWNALGYANNAVRPVRVTLPERPPPAS